MDDSELAEMVNIKTFFLLHSFVLSHAIVSKTCRTSQVGSIPFLSSSNDVFPHFCSMGNTCYMNSTIQAFRAIPELQVALSASVIAAFFWLTIPPNTDPRPSLQSPTPLPNALRDLYRQMSQTTDSIHPSRFLQVLREVDCFDSLLCRVLDVSLDQPPVRWDG
jgi:hypothetical protein